MGCASTADRAPWTKWHPKKKERREERKEKEGETNEKENFGVFVQRDDKRALTKGVGSARLSRKRNDIKKVCEVIFGETSTKVRRLWSSHGIYQNP